MAVQIFEVDQLFKVMGSFKIRSAQGVHKKPSSRRFVWFLYFYTFPVISDLKFLILSCCSKYFPFNPL